MKIVVVGGTGLIGSKVVAKLAARGHVAVAASPASGVDTLRGEGLAEAFAGAHAVVDVSNSPSFADEDVLAFFTKSTTNQLAVEREMNVRHHVALSIVGSDRVPDSGYLRAKVAQERIIADSGVPYSIVRATQFYEFVDRVADEATVGTTIRLPPALLQPMAAEDVASVVARVAERAPIDGTLEIGGPDRLGMDELVRLALAQRGDPRTVVTDPEARYFGARLSSTSLVPGPGAELFETTFSDWLAGRHRSSVRL